MDELKQSALIRYRPLLVIVSICMLAALVLGGDAMAVMRQFMGMFFILFSMFKFFDLGGFAKGFRKYDIVAQNLPVYGRIYPFIELGLGLLYLSGTCVVLTSVATILLMAISAAGVGREIWRGNQFTCACLGTTLNVPLSTVSLVENLGMGAMAAWMLLH